MIGDIEKSQTGHTEYYVRKEAPHPRREGVAVDPRARGMGGAERRKLEFWKLDELFVDVNKRAEEDANKRAEGDARQGKVPSGGPVSAEFPNGFES